MEMKKEFIDAGVARRYLQRVRPEDQRRLSSATVKKYTTAMLKEKFDGLNGETIKFDTNNSLIDGQHRLHAIVKADVTIPMLVLRGVHNSAKSTLDCGQKRSKADILKYAGFDMCTNAVAGVLSAMVGQGVIGAVAREDVVDYAFKYEEGLTFVVDCFTKNLTSVTTAPVKANVARAYYSEDRGRLREFVNVLVSGIPKSEDDTAAILLRTWLLINRQARDGASVLEVYQKTQRALRAFLDREPIKRLYRAREEQFPIP